MSTGTARAWNQILATKTSKPPVSSDRSYNKRLGLICIIIWTARELLLIVWLGHKHITLSPDWILQGCLITTRKKKRHNNCNTATTTSGRNIQCRSNTCHCAQGVPVPMALWENSENFKPSLLCDVMVSPTECLETAQFLLNMLRLLITWHWRCTHANYV